MPYSHHSHSGQFCKHASGTLEEVVLEAIRQGFELFGLTEHAPRYRTVDLYPEEEGLSPEDLHGQFSDFVLEAHRLKEIYSSKIKLLVGLETEYIQPADIDPLEALLKSYGSHIEYIVGSVHHVNSIPIDFDLETYKKAVASFPTENDQQLETYLCTYFDAQYGLMQRLHPEVIGHIDLCRLYTPDLSLKDYPAVWGKLKRNVRFATEYGALFELNAAAFRKGWSSAYPAKDIVTVIQEHGGRFALSDDSHGPHAVGLNYPRLLEYARRVIIKELWTLEKSDEANVGGRFVRARKVEGDWWEHPFWSKASNLS